MFFRNSRDTEDTKKSHSPFKFLGMMGICCLLPIVLVGLIPLLQLGAGANLFLSGLSSLICPIMMVVMMVFMMKGSKKSSCCSKTEEVEDRNNM